MLLVPEAARAFAGSAARALSRGAGGSLGVAAVRGGGGDGRGRGLLLSLSPALGHERRGLDRLWEDGVAAPGASSSSGARLAAGAGYGLPLPGGPGTLLTPRIGLAATDGGQRRYSAGLALEAARTEPPAAPTERKLTVTLNLRWRRRRPVRRRPGRGVLPVRNRAR